MILFFLIITLIATFVVYSLVHASLVLFIGLGFASGIILSSIYWGLKSNFYVQSVYIFLNSVAQLILLLTISNPYNSGALWIIYTILIFWWMKDWILHFSEYNYENHIKPYAKAYTKKHGSLNQYSYNRHVDAINGWEDFKFYLFAIPYAVLNVFLLIAYNFDPSFRFVVFLSPVSILICTVIFLITFKVKGIEPTGGRDDNITSFGDVFLAFGKPFKAIGSALLNFFKLFTLPFKRSYRGRSRTSSSYSSGSSRRKARTKPQRSYRSRSYSYSSGDFSVISLVLPLVFFAIVILFIFLERESILSSQVGNWGEWILNFVFERSRWFAHTRLVFNDCLLELNTDTFINLLTIVPLGILTLALLALTAVIETVLSALYALIGLAVAAIAALLSLILTFVPGVLVLATIVVAIITFKDNCSRANKITTGIILPMEVIACVYYFIVLFSHRV